MKKIFILTLALLLLSTSVLGIYRNRGFRVWRYKLIIGSGGLFLKDTDDSHVCQIKWNENDTADRIFNFKVNSGNRTFSLWENLTVADGFDFTLTAEDVAGSIVLDEQTLEIEGEGTATQLVKIINANNAAATITLEGTSSVINQDVTDDASPTWATVFANILDTKVAAAGVTLSGTTLQADGTNATIDIVIIPKGDGAISVVGTTDYEGDVTNDDDIPNKKYVDDLVTAQDLDFAGDAGTGAVDLDSQTFTIAGTTNEIETSASNQTIIIGLPDVVEFKTAGFVNATELTIATGVITVTQSVHTIDGESDAADDLDTINGGSQEMLILIRPNNAARNITLTNSGNIITSTGFDYTIPDNGMALLQYDGTSWRIVAGGGEFPINNDTYMTSIDNAGTGTVNMFKVNTSDEIEVGATFNIGAMDLTEDSGAITVMNMPVSATPNDGDVMSIGVSIDSNPILKLKALADGSGGADSFQAVIGTVGLFSTTTTLSAAQVNALRASPQTVVDSYGANTWIELVSAVITYDYGSAAFTVGADEDLVIEWADGTDATASIETTGFLDQVDDEIRFYPFVLSAGADPEASLNQALRIFNSGTGETADGVDSEVDITVVYRVFSTGF